ncbi:MAG: tRNA glutamyl-Q(34) synthetase GluQRS [Flavobacteriaceae bacterium]
MTQPVFRFAPSPNGHLHLGHALSALLNQRAAQAAGGRLLLRIEDIDPARSREDLVAAILEDLAWLGIEWEEPVRGQSDHMADYIAAAARLEARGLLYPCCCTRQEIAAASTARDPDGAPLYPGTCRPRDDTERASPAGDGGARAMRLDMAACLAELDKMPRFSETDPQTGESREIVAEPARWGDVVIQRKDTPTSYHLAVVVDDHLQGITHVLRGMDLLASTDVHRVLQELLGFAPPRYSHHRLILDAEGRKLSKSLASTALRSLRANGATPADIRRLVGLS